MPKKLSARLSRLGTAAPAAEQDGPDGINLSHLVCRQLAHWPGGGIVVGAHVKGEHALPGGDFSGPFNPLFIGEPSVSPLQESPK